MKDKLLFKISFISGNSGFAEEQGKNKTKQKQNKN